MSRRSLAANSDGVSLGCGPRLPSEASRIVFSHSCTGLAAPARLRSQANRANAAAAAASASIPARVAYKGQWLELPDEAAGFGGVIGDGGLMPRSIPGSEGSRVPRLFEPATVGGVPGRL